MPTTNQQWGSLTVAPTVAAVFSESIKGRTILITGVNRTGLGYATANAFASQSPSAIVITGRSAAKLQESVDSLYAIYPSIAVKPLIIDLSSQKSVREAASKLLSWNDIPSIDIVVNNAGVMNIQERTLSIDGAEMHFATNHLGHFLFTNLLMPKILAGKNKRIVNVSSVGTFVSPIRFSDLRWEKSQSSIPDAEKVNVAMLSAAKLPISESTTYTPFGAYGASKTANILYSAALNARLSNHGVLSVALHPGEIMTELQRSTDLVWLANNMKGRAEKGMPGFKTLEEGAATALVAATDPKLGRMDKFLNDCQVSEKVPPYAVDEEIAERLWNVSEELVGEKFVW